MPFSELEMALLADYGATLFMVIFYMILGVLSTILGILNIYIYSRRSLRNRYLYQLAYEVFELVDSISYILTSIGRGSALLGGTFKDPITVHDCFFAKYWVHSLILGMEWPCYMVILMSLERILASVRPVIYKKYFSSPSKLYFVLVVFLLGLISLAIGGYSSWGDMTPNLTRHCAIISSTSIAYSTFHFAFPVVAYGVSFISLLSVYAASSHVEGIAGDRLQKVRLMICICGISIALVSMPSIVMIGIKWNVWTVSDLVVALTYGMPGCLTIANTVINLVFRPDYRDILIQSFWCSSCGQRKPRISVTPYNSQHSHFHIPHTVMTTMK